MTYQINQATNPYAQPLTGVNSQSMQNIDSEQVKKTVNNSPIAKVTDQKKSSPALIAGVFLPTWLAVHWGMNKFSKGCTGDYDTSLLGKIEKFNKKLKASKAYDNSVVAWIRKTSKSIKAWSVKNIINKNQILKSIFMTPAVPENRNVLMMATGIGSEVASAATQVFEKFTNNGTDLEKIKELGFIKKDKLGEILRDAEGKEIADVEKYKDVVKNPHKFRTKIMHICEKQGKKEAYEVSQAGKIPWSARFTKNKQPVYLTDVFSFLKGIFTKKVDFSEFANKLRGSKGGLTKTSLRIVEGFANATTAGGVIGSLMGAWFVADAILRTIKAPKGKGEKRKTFAENMLYNLGFYMTMPIAITTMFGIGGIKYIGTDKIKLRQYRRNLEEFNKKTLDCTWKDQAEYKKASKELDQMLNSKIRLVKGEKLTTRIGKILKNIVHKPLTWIGKIFMVGLEGKRGFRTSDASKYRKFMADFGFRIKDYASYPVRMLAFMLIFAPFFAKFFAKGSHLIFGKPTKSVLDEGKEEKPEAVIAPAQDSGPQVMNPATMAPVANKVNNLQNNQMMDTPQKKESLIDAHMNANAAAPAPSQNKYIPSDEGVKLFSETKAPLTEIYKQNRKDAAAEAARGPARFYVPTDDAARIKPGSEKGRFSKDVPTVDEAMNKADKTEKMLDKLMH